MEGAVPAPAHTAHAAAPVVPDTYIITAPAHLKGLEGVNISENRLKLCARFGNHVITLEEQARINKAAEDKKKNANNPNANADANNATAPAAPAPADANLPANLPPRHGVFIDLADPAITTVTTQLAQETSFPAWQFKHRTGWRTYAPKESSQIEKAFQDRKATVEILRGGQSSNNYIIKFMEAVDGYFGAHDGKQISSSGNIRAVRRFYYTPENVTVNDKQGWVLSYPTVAQNTVHAIYQFSHDEAEKIMTVDEAHKLLTENAEEFERTHVLDALSLNPERLDYQQASLNFDVERYKYGRHPALLEVIGDQPPLIMWEWWHGGARTNCDYRAYRGADCEVLEHGFQTDADMVLLNGGKPMAGLPARPLQVQLNRSWFKGFEAFAFHTQLDLCTRRRRGVKRSLKYKGNKDFIYYMWLREFKRAPAMDVYKVYVKFLEEFTKIVRRSGAGSGIVNQNTLKTSVAAEVERARVRLRTLDEASTWTAPPQDDIPEEFLCPTTLCLMEEPTYCVNNPLTARMEGKDFREWVTNNHTHPLTREPIASVDELVVDEELKGEIVKWIRSFIPGAEAVPNAE